MSNPRETGHDSSERLVIPKMGEFRFVPEVVVPEFLQPDENILDQPPYQWLLREERILPSDFFKSPQCSAFFIKFVTSKAYQPGNVNRKVRDSVNKKVYRRPAIEYALGKAREFLERYPLSIEYLQEHWIPELFDKVGGRQASGYRWRVQTYAAFAETRLRLEMSLKHSQWKGLAKELPDASAADDIVKTMPQKKGMNRWFRILRLEAIR